MNYIFMMFKIQKLIIFYKMNQGKKVKPNEEEENEEDLSSYEEEEDDGDEEIPDDGKYLLTLG